MLDNIKKNKILFLWLNSTEFHAVNAQRRGVDIADVFRQTPKILKIFRRAHIKMQLGFIRPWLNSLWVNDLHTYDTVIIHASKLTPPVVRYINQIAPKTRVIVWYWNPISKSEPIESFSSLNCEIWTFDEKDAIDYSLQHNTQYYFNDVGTEKTQLKNQVLFVGTDKGRLDYLLQIEQTFKQIGIKTEFHIVGNPIKIEKQYEYQKRIPYSEILYKISYSKAILDIVSDNQSGLTLRPLEALYFKKKLITNDRNIIQRDFYNPHNIFILGVNNNSDLLEFLDSPYVENDYYIRSHYDFDEWLRRFNI